MRSQAPVLWAAIFGLAAVFLLGIGCQKTPEAPVAPVLNRVENTEMGIAIGDLVSTFRVVGTEPTRIDLELIEGEGRLEIFSMEKETNINIVAALNEHKADIEGRPGSEYKGGNELVLAAIPGAVYYSRGRFDGEQGRLEETAVLMIHPWKDRQMRAIYTYPAGEDSKVRLEDQLFAVVSELEGLSEPTEAVLEETPAEETSAAE